MKPQTKRHNAGLDQLCRAIATLARVAGSATHAVLINANAARITLGNVRRGGTLLVIRFPEAAIARDERPLQELIDEKQPPVTYHIHTQEHTLGNAERLDGAAPEYATSRRQRKDEQA